MTGDDGKKRHPQGGSRTGGFHKGPRHHGGERGSTTHRIVHRTAKFGSKGPRSSRPRQENNNAPIPELGENIRIVPLGGVEEVGKNMTAFEFGNDIFVVDAGFQFSEEDTPGIDYILPNTKYLEDRKGKIRAVFITHGHLDHIGAIPYLMEKIGNPPIYARNFTALMIKKRQEEFPHVPPLDIRVVEKGEHVKISGMPVTFFAVTHAIPDSMGIIFETPYGDIVHTGDLRLDHIDGNVSEIEEEIFSHFKKRNVLALLTDSTNAENPGFSISEKLVYKNIEEIIKNTKGRLILSTFASQVERMLKMIELSEKYGKKIVIEGRSMKTNIEVTKIAGLLKIGKESIITVEEMGNYPENKIVALVTGAQGEEFAALMRIANKTHKYIRLSPRDTILMSSSIVPGNERNVQKLKDNLSRQGAHIIHYKTSDIHSSGHANAEELAWIHEKIHPKFFIPIHGYHYMHRVHADIAKRVVPENNIIIPDNGMIIEIQNKGEKIVALKEKAARNIIMVDGFSVGDIQEVVIRDRQTLAQDGIFVVVASVDSSTGILRKSPDIISRGFVYLKESQDLLRQTRNIVKKTIEDTTHNMRPINFDYVKSNVTDAVEKFLFQKTAKRPIVIPVLIGV
ncbi:MAG: ribonuclease J [Patescibacteria group bacterium]